MAFGRFFFSAAPTAQTCQEFHFRFINYFIQSSLLRSLLTYFKTKADSYKINPTFQYIESLVCNLMLSFDRGSSRLLDWKDTRPHKLRLAMTLAVIGSRIPEEMKHQPFQLWLKPNSVHHACKVS